MKANYHSLRELLPEHTPANLLERCERAEQGETLWLALQDLARYVRGHSLLLGQQLTQAALEVALQSNYTSGVARSLISLAFIATRLAQYDRSLDYLHRTLEIIQEHQLFELESSAYNVRAIAYMGMGDMVGAYHDLHQAIDLAHLHQNYSDLASSYNNMAWLEYTQQEGEAALHYVDMMGEVLQKVSPEERIHWRSFLYSNRTAAYIVLIKKAIARRRSGALKEALEKGKIQLRKMREAINKLPDETHEDSYYSYASYFALLSGELSEAYAFAQRAIAATEKSGQLFSVEPYKCMAEIYIAQGKDDQALEYYYKALGILRRQRRTWEEQEVSKAIMQIYQRMGDYDEALTLAYECLESFRHEMRRVSSAAQRQISLIRELREVTHQANTWQERLIQAEQIARHDVLTGLLNRLGLREAQLVLRDHVSRKGLYLAVSYIDIDHFKQVNDQFSHAVGDQVLKELGQLLKGLLPEHAVIGRYGGEEFVILAPFATPADAAAFMEHCRASVEQHNWQGVHPQLSLTVSIGYVLTKGGQLEQAYLEADEHLYAAKNSGRNAVCPTEPEILG